MRIIVEAISNQYVRLNACQELANCAGVVSTGVFFFQYCDCLKIYRAELLLFCIGLSV